MFIDREASHALVSVCLSICLSTEVELNQGEPLLVCEICLSVCIQAAYINVDNFADVVNWHLTSIFANAFL